MVSNLREQICCNLKKIKPIILASTVDRVTDRTHWLSWRNLKKNKYYSTSSSSCSSVSELLGRLYGHGVI